MDAILTSLRISLATASVCVAGYTAVILALAQGISPDTANGHLITSPDGRILGSRQVSQAFTHPGYFWPRPSAVDYDGAGAGGSNKSPTAPELTERAEALVALHGATAQRPVPPELVTASGGGLDPHVSERAALFQVDRVARARGLDAPRVETLVRERAFHPGGILTPDRIVNVLDLNLALDALAVGARGTR
jgi:K+-transporting ATPase ATPase C chain